MTARGLAALHAAGVITAREQDILLLQLHGLSQYTIAIALDISRSTVRNHQRNAHDKIERNRRKDAA